MNNGRSIFSGISSIYLRWRGRVSRIYNVKQTDCNRPACRTVPGRFINRSDCRRALEAVFMGVVNIGGASAAEPGIATAVGTAFAIMMGKGSEVALTLALPIGILGLQIKTLLYIFIVGMFAKTFDRLAQEGKQKQITALHYGLWAVNWALYSLVAFFGILFGSEAVSAFLEWIPDVVMNGLTVCGGLLPAVGMAMLMKMLWDKKICMFFFWDLFVWHIWNCHLWHLLFLA